MRKAWEGFATQLDGEAQIRKYDFSDFCFPIFVHYINYISSMNCA